MLANQQHGKKVLVLVYEEQWCIVEKGKGSGEQLQALIIIYHLTI